MSKRTNINDVYLHPLVQYVNLTKDKIKFLDKHFSKDIKKLLQEYRGDDSGATSYEERLFFILIKYAELNKIDYEITFLTATSASHNTVRKDFIQRANNTGYRSMAATIALTETGILGITKFDIEPYICDPSDYDCYAATDLDEDENLLFN